MAPPSPTRATSLSLRNTTRSSMAPSSTPAPSPSTKGTLVFNAPLSTNNLGTLARTGGSVVIQSNLSSPSGTVDLDNDFHGNVTFAGSTNVSHFTASNGSVLTLTSQTLPSTPIFTHNPVVFSAPNVTFSTDVDVQNSAQFAGNLTLDQHTLFVQQNANLSFGGGQLTGLGQILFQNANSTNTPALLYAPSNATLTIGPNVTVTTDAQSNSVYLNLGTPGGTFANYGT